MTKAELVDKLNSDLANEWKHMQFYLYSSIIVKGLARIEVKEFLLEHAKSEFNHIQEFSQMILGLGGIPSKSINAFPTLTDPRDIISYALDIEREVVNNYVTRIKEAQELGGVDGSFIEIFLEDQILDSRKDVDELKEINHV